MPMHDAVPDLAKATRVGREPRGGGEARAPGSSLKLARGRADPRDDGASGGDAAL